MRVRVSALVSSLACIVFSWNLDSERWYMGFPDGGITAYDLARRPALVAFEWITLLFGAWCLYLGIRLPQDARRKLVVSLLAYVVIRIIFYGIDIHFWNHLDHGQGG